MQPTGLFPTAFWGLDDRRADRDYKLADFFLTDKLLRDWRPVHFRCFPSGLRSERRGPLHRRSQGTQSEL